MAYYYIGIPTDGNGLHDWIEPHYIQTPTGDQYITLEYRTHSGLVGHVGAPNYKIKSK